MNNDYGKDIGDRIREDINAKVREKMQAHSTAANTGTLVSGLVIVLVGMVLLLAQLGFFSWSSIWQFWPFIFIAIGLGKVCSGRQAGRVSGLFMLVLGALLLMHEFGRFPYGIIQLWPLLIIAGGAELFWNAWHNPTVVDSTGMRVTNSSELNTTSIFGSSEVNIVSQAFRGGEIVAIFGGFQVDLTRAEISGSAAKIEATAVFGGGEIHVPPTWTVVVKGVGIFGGYTDETQQLPNEPGKPQKVLYVEGAAVFGGVVVKN